MLCHCFYDLQYIAQFSCIIKLSHFLQCAMLIIMRNSYTYCRILQYVYMNSSLNDIYVQILITFGKYHWASYLCVCHTKLKSPYCSRRHASIIFLVDGRLRIKNHSSSNFIFVNDVKLQSTCQK